MKKLLLISLLFLVLTGCATHTGSATQGLSDEGTIALARYVALLNLGTKAGCISSGEREELDQYATEFVRNVPFNVALFKKTRTALEESSKKPEPEKVCAVLHASIPRWKEWFSKMNYAWGQEKQRKATATHNQQIQFINQITNTLNAVNNNLNQTAKNMRSYSAQLPSVNIYPIKPIRPINSLTNTNSRYRSSSGTTYQYDLNNPIERNAYSLDLDAQRRDQMSSDPGKTLDEKSGQRGGGIYKD